MRLKHLALGLAVVIAVPAAVATAQAEDGIYVPLFTYRTGPYAGSGIPIANGLSDYLHMLNERDGGIGGARLIIDECETGYDTKKGVECYDSVKGKNPVVITPYSTGITLQLIPKAAVDKIPILSMAYGLSASADGNLFPWIFNAPATYWDGASAFIRHAADVEGGFDKLKGKKIGLVHLDAPYGKEPIPTAASAGQGLRLRAQALSGPGLADAEPDLALARRAARPARLDLYPGLGRHEPDRRSRKRPRSASRWIGWSACGGRAGDDDARPAGAAGQGL